MLSNALLLQCSLQRGQGYLYISIRSELRAGRGSLPCRTNAVHWSNRVLALLKAGGEQQVTAAVAAAAKCRELRPDWAKGYYRDGAALVAAGNDTAPAWRFHCLRG